MNPFDSIRRLVHLSASSKPAALSEMEEILEELNKTSHGRRTFLAALPILMAACATTKLWLVAPIIDSVRELYHRVTGVEAKTQELENEVAELRQKNLELEQRLQRLEQSLNGGSSRKPSSE